MKAVASECLNADLLNIVLSLFYSTAVKCGA